MRNFIKENWFKLLVVLFLGVIACTLLYSLVLRSMITEKRLSQCIETAKETLREDVSPFKDLWRERCIEHNREIGEEGLCDLPPYATDDFKKELNQAMYKYNKAEDECNRKYNVK